MTSARKTANPLRSDRRDTEFDSRALDRMEEDINIVHRIPLTDDEVCNVMEATWELMDRFSPHIEEAIEGWLHYEWPEICPCLSCRIVRKRISQIADFWKSIN